MSKIIETGYIKKDITTEKNEDVLLLQLASSQRHQSIGKLQRTSITDKDSDESKYGKVLEAQAIFFYKNNKTKFMQTTDFDSSKEQESFKEILRFSKRQSATVETRFYKAEVPKFNFIELNSVNHMSKLAKLLASKNLRNYKIKNPEGSDFDDYEEESDKEEEDNHANNRKGAQKEKKLFFNETLAKKYNTITEKLTHRKKLINYMYKKSASNQIKSKTFYDLSVLENNVSTAAEMKTKRPKTSGPALPHYQTKNSTNKFNSASYMESSRIINLTHERLAALLNAKSAPREFITEKDNFDVSRNYTSKTYPFKVTQNRFNSKIEVFKPPPVNAVFILPPSSQSKSAPRPKTATLGTNMSSSSLMLNSLDLSSNLVTKSNSSKRSQETTSKSLSNKNDTANSNATPRIPISLEYLAKNSKVLYSKCVSSFWKNYSEV